MFAKDPLLHITAPEKAMRLAALIINKSPEINAALFIAPGRGGEPGCDLRLVAVLPMDHEIGIELGPDFRCAGLQRIAYHRQLPRQMVSRVQIEHAVIGEIRGREPTALRQRMINGGNNP